VPWRKPFRTNALEICHVRSTKGTPNGTLRPVSGSAPRPDLPASSASAVHREANVTPPAEDRTRRAVIGEPGGFEGAARNSCGRIRWFRALRRTIITGTGREAADAVPLSRRRNIFRRRYGPAVALLRRRAFFSGVSLDPPHARFPSISVQAQGL